MSALRINDLAPDFKAKTTHGEINFHDWIGDSLQNYKLNLKSVMLRLSV